MRYPLPTIFLLHFIHLRFVFSLNDIRYNARNFRTEIYMYIYICFAGCFRDRGKQNMAFYLKDGKKSRLNEYERNARCLARIDR